MPVKVFAAVCYSAETAGQKALEQLEELLGAIVLKSERFLESDFTNYYEAEMGATLNKYFIAFKNLMPAESLVDIKIKTNEFERKSLEKGQRTVNIDPGYLTEAKVVLATTKDYSHRLYLGRGIYGDLHLTYSKKSYRALPWTYPDYQQQTAIDFFNRLRVIYKEETTH